MLHAKSFTADDVFVSMSPYQVKQMQFNALINGEWLHVEVISKPLMFNVQLICTHKHSSLSITSHTS